jgi:hypothetical protein
MDEADALDNSFSTFCEDYNELPNPLDYSPAKQFYLDNNWSMFLLATLSINVRDASGLPLIDVQNDPWNKIPKKSIKPLLDALCTEIQRCWNTLQQEGKVPALKHWDKII